MKTKNPYCGSCFINPADRLLSRGRGGRVKVWRCQHCLAKRGQRIIFRRENRVMA